MRRVDGFVTEGVFGDEADRAVEGRGVGVRTQGAVGPRFEVGFPLGRIERAREQDDGALRVLRAEQPDVLEVYFPRAAFEEDDRPGIARGIQRADRRGHVGDDPQVSSRELYEVGGVGVRPCSGLYVDDRVFQISFFTRSLSSIGLNGLTM